MTGFRASFYPEDPHLHSIEVLAWASSVPCFTFGEVLAHFRVQLGEYKDPSHEISERLRKLAKTGMLVSVDEARLQSTAFGHELPADKKVAIAERLSEVALARKGRRGRPSRVYTLTQAGQKQVDRRLEDLEEIRKSKASKKKGRKG